MSPNFKSEELKSMDDINGVLAINEQKNLKNKEWNCFDHIIWPNVILISSVHTLAIYGGYLLFTEAKLLTILFSKFNIYLPRTIFYGWSY